MKPISNKQWITFFIGGVLFLSLVATIKYLTGQDMTFLATIVPFIFGGMVAILATSKHTSLIKNVVFGFTIFWLLWVLFQPLDVTSDSIFIKRVEFWTLIIVGLMFMEREIWNSIRIKAHKKPIAQMGFFANVLFIAWWWLSGLSDRLAAWIGENYVYIIIFMLGWMVIFYFIVSKNLKKMSNRVIKLLK